MSYEEMNWLDYTVSIIKEFVDRLPPDVKDMLLGILITAIKELRGGYDTHS